MNYYIYYILLQGCMFSCVWLTLTRAPFVKVITVTTVNV